MTRPLKNLCQVLDKGFRAESTLNVLQNRLGMMLDPFLRGELLLEEQRENNL